MTKKVVKKTKKQEKVVVEVEQEELTLFQQEINEIRHYVGERAFLATPTTEILKLAAYRERSKMLYSAILDITDSIDAVVEALESKGF